MLFYSLHFVYIDFDGNEVLQKDSAAVTVDGRWFIKLSFLCMPYILLMYFVFLITESHSSIGILIFYSHNYFTFCRHVVITLSELCGRMI